ncbi:PhoX family phosphatase [Nakamurella flavida]|uniref:PhoX family phosphatase n=1 Tax=Nakamurella flavida TaxID=363630 RepID=A0A938YPN2_9ACTN|nr:PhoX family phosphatase [Nakamurella flavida]MBM9476680.1 PhoX family phosphatase [Nakamurella flavida]
MDGHTRGKRSPVTCHLKCADACAHPVPNPTANPTFRSIADTVLNRRKALGLAGAGAAALTLGPALLGGMPAAAAAPAAPDASGQAAGVARGGARPAGGLLRFSPIAPVPADVDAVTVPEGYSWSPIIRWGDPILPGGVAFDALAQTPEKQALQFGYNNDYLDIIVNGAKGLSGLLVANHEYVNPAIMFPPTVDTVTAKKIAKAAHGMSVVGLKRSTYGTPWTYDPAGRKNRRITADTPFTLTGPAAGCELLRTTADPAGRTVLGTFGNCSGGTTPWGTVLSGEENFNGYFRTTGVSAAEKRYGLKDAPSTYGWEEIDPRFDARSSGDVHEPNRFGWIVEIDPEDPTATPLKHTAMGRFKHEGANVTLSGGRPVAYMGDDERFDYLYKFVSARSMRTGTAKADREYNRTLLTEGDLYVARFSGDSPVAEIDGTGKLPSDGAFDGTGTWIALTRGGKSAVPGFTVQEVLVNTRLAADTVGATKMDRCEDVQPHRSIAGRVYVACTNNTDRGKAGKEGATEVAPRLANRDGHIVEINEDKGNACGTTFTWNLLLVCGDPATNDSTYFAGYPKDKVSPISCPDNVAFDASGNLWISTDGAPSTIGYNDGLFKVGLSGRERGRVQQFLAVPTGAETCGPVVHERDGRGMAYVAVQHPGEDGTWDAQLSRFPDYVPVGQAAKPGQFAGPRPSVIQVW